MDVGSQLVALADPTRRSIYELIREAPSSVRELTDRVPISQPAVSQHLKVLGAAGLVSSMPDGARRIYRVDPAGVAQLRAWIDVLWDDVLDNFTKAARKEHDQ
jgi:DNA-binding transcriptional ArsR family regulator